MWEKGVCIGDYRRELESIGEGVESAILTVSSITRCTQTDGRGGAENSRRAYPPAARDGRPGNSKRRQVGITARDDRPG